MNKRGMSAILLALPFSAAGAAFTVRSIGASAASAPAFWSGSNATGVIPVENASICVEKEVLTISVPEFPKPGCSEEEFCAYGASLTAEYTFSNPTDTDQKATLVFPCGAAPDYAPWSDDFSSYKVDLRPVICVNGVTVSSEARDSYIGSAYTASDSYGFDVDEGITRLYAAQSDFYEKELTVYVHTFEMSVPATAREMEPWNWVTFALDFECNAKNTRVFCSDNAVMTTLNGRGHIKRGFNAAAGEPVTFRVYAVGEDVQIVATKIYKYDGGKERVVEDAVITEKPCDEVNFSELVSSFRTATCSVSAEDWYNGFVDMLEENATEGCMSYGTPQGLSARSFMRWYEYKIEIPAGETLVNSVTAPIYPSVEGSAQNIYKYVYLLSPAQKWAEHGDIEIHIETPYYISDSTLDFAKREGGYTFTRERLPMGELSFSLTEEERIHTGPKYPTYSGGTDVLTTALVVLSVIMVGAVVVVSVVYFCVRRRVKLRQEEERRLPMGRAVEGTIDLPPENKQE